MRANRKPPVATPGCRLLPMVNAPVLLWILWMLLSGTLQPQADPVPTPREARDEGGQPIQGSPVGQGLDAELSITQIGAGRARIRCLIQRLEGEVSSSGLRIRSTRDGDAGGPLRVVADYLGRDGGAMVGLSESGLVEVEHAVARRVRPDCIEEFRVDLDGVRQDFVIPRPPAGPGALRVELLVEGARVERRGGRIELQFLDAERRLAYGRLHVEDAAGNRLPAEMVRVDAGRLALVIDDATAIYPVRIDPTFSDANWTGLGALGGSDAPARTIVFDDSGNIYIGGEISAVGDVVVRRIAMWDGSRWSDLGEGLPISVDRLLFFEGSLHACGRQIGTGYQVLKREGPAWVPLGGAFNGTIEAMKPHLGALHVAGWFNQVGEEIIHHIARWDGNEWQPLGSGIEGITRDLLSHEGELYAGGAFLRAGGVSASRVAKWNGTSWSPLGTGLSGDVNALVNYRGSVVAGGSFNRAGANSALRVARWDGASWVGLGGMAEDFVIVNSLAVAGDTLYAAGTFNVVSGQVTRGLAQLNQTWTAVGTGFRGPAAVVATLGSNVYVGGGQVEADGFASSGFSWWDGTRWGTLGDPALGLDRGVSALAWFDDALHVGGSFRTAGGKLVNHVARWDGSEWHAVGGGVQNTANPTQGAAVQAFTVMDGALYMAGTFDRAGEAEATNIARWDGVTWSALGNGLRSGVINDLTGYDGKLFVGGGLFLSGNELIPHLAVWDGSAWSPFNPGIGATVHALAVMDGSLYIGGDFRAVSANFASHYVGRWDGSALSALGPGVNNTVTALLPAGGKLYAGGNFTSAGGAPARGMAEWDGTGWHAMGDGVGITVSALASFGDQVFVGGNNPLPHVSAIPSLLRWDGETWLEAGSGVNGRVRALLAIGDELFVGGEFSTAGGRVAARLAKLRQGATNPNRAVGIAVAGGSVRLRFMGTPGMAYQVLRSLRLGAAQEWSVMTAAPIVANESGEFEFEEATLPGAAYYRSQESE
ncbi:MAG: hypothetical protein KF791_11870 [Verrucomicrobiae bacterium]|nr:hypothetical protein [Verrucomicrobiae bacterium]